MTRARLRSMALAEAAAIRTLQRERAASAASAAGNLLREAECRRAEAADVRASAERAWHDLMEAPRFDPGLAALSARAVLNRQADLLLVEEEAGEAGRAADTANAALGRASALAEVARKLAAGAARRDRRARDERALLGVEDRSARKARP